MGSSPEPAVLPYRSLRLLRKHRQVLGADLNRSELVRKKPPDARAARWSAYLYLSGRGAGPKNWTAPISGRGGASVFECRHKLRQKP
jgi:hypothetical protein